MKKPELKDFGLTEELLDLNKKQHEKYYKQLEEYCNSVKKIKIAIIVISLIITFIAFIVNCANGFKSEDAGITLGIFAFWDITVVLCCFQSLDASIWDIRESKKDEIKTRTMNISLDTAVEKYNKAVRDYERYLKKCSIDFWNSLNGFEFEKEIAKLFRKQGYDATVTSATADGGVDIILRKNGERIAVQCKHHAKPVGPNDVRALQGVVAAQDYSKGIFVSLNGFTSSVYYEVRNGRVKIELLELKDILEMAMGECEEHFEKPKMVFEEDDEEDDEEDCMGEKPHLGEFVIHRSFGEGRIIEVKQTEKGEMYLTVEFAHCIKKFIFPDAFLDGFLAVHGDEAN